MVYSNYLERNKADKIRDDANLVPLIDIFIGLFAFGESARRAIEVRGRFC